jgi:YD repeat-containing protein
VVTSGRTVASQLESGPSVTYTYNEFGERTKTTPTTGRHHDKRFAPHLTPAQRRRVTLTWNQTVNETGRTKSEWFESAGGLARALGPPTAERNSATSVGNLEAPVEASTTLNGSRSLRPR